MQCERCARADRFSFGTVDDSGEWLALCDTCRDDLRAADEPNPWDAARRAQPNEAPVTRVDRGLRAPAPQRRRRFGRRGESE